MKWSKLLLSISSKLLISLVAVLAICFAIGGKSVNVLWGVPLPKSELELLIRPFLRWHLLTIPPLLFACEYLSCIQHIEIFIRIRLKCSRKFAQMQIIPCAIISALWGSLVALVGFIVSPVEFAINAFLLTAIGHIMWMCFFLSLYFIVESVPIALIVTILSIVSVFYIGELLNPKWKYLPTSWGMVFRSKLYDSSGIPPDLALRNALLVICGTILIIHFVNWQRRRKL